MSYDVFLQRFKAGKPAKVNLERLRAVLDSADHTGPDDFGFYIVRFQDGAQVELSARGLDGQGEFQGCAFHVRATSDQAIQFIHDMARAGDMVILADTDDPVLILTDPKQDSQLPDDVFEAYPEAVVCRSATELRQLLEGGYPEWSRHRDAAAEDEED